MVLLTPKAEALKHSLNKEEFKDFSFTILDKLEKDRYNGLSLEQYQDIAENKHKKIFNALTKTLMNNPSHQKGKIVYLNIISFFLDEALYHYGTEASEMVEDKVLNFIFDRFIRKYYGSVQEKRQALRALIFLYRAMYSWKLIPEELNLFVKSLKDDEPFFIKHCNNYKGSGFFWDKNPAWEANYYNWLDRKGLALYLYPQDISSVQYVGLLENDLTRTLEPLLFLKRRELIKKYEENSPKIQEILIEEMNSWYDQPQNLLDGLTPRDVILLEREFMNIDL